jgi:hypothetical protein
MLDWFLLFCWLTPTFQASSWEKKKSSDISICVILFDIMLRFLAASKKLSFIFPISYPPFKSLRGLLLKKYFSSKVKPMDIKKLYFIADLKVVGNEKLGGLKFLQLLGIRLGPSISIFISNMPFANTKGISVSGLSSKMSRR